MKASVPCMTALLCLLKSDGGSAYSSKLDDFEAFVARSKLAALQLQPSRAQHGTAEEPVGTSQASQSQADKHMAHQVAVTSHGHAHCIVSSLHHNQNAVMLCWYWSCVFMRAPFSQQHDTKECHPP